MSKTREITDSTWETISTELGSIGKLKPPEECKLKWDDMVSTYETCKKLNMDYNKYSFFEKIGEVLNQDNLLNCENQTNVAHSSCKCSERKLAEKQRRHAERMQVLKRKLDIEERKVKAFEEYIKYIKR